MSFYNGIDVKMLFLLRTNIFFYVQILYYIKIITSAINLEKKLGVFNKIMMIIFIINYSNARGYIRGSRLAAIY